MLFYKDVSNPYILLPGIQFNFCSWSLCANNCHCVTNNSGGSSQGATIPNTSNISKLPIYMVQFLNQLIECMVFRNNSIIVDIFIEHVFYFFKRDQLKVQW